MNVACHKVFQANLAETNDIETLDDLIARLKVVRRELGKNVPVSVSVYQETAGNSFGSFYEDRKICANIEVVNVDGSQFVELAI